MRNKKIQPSAHTRMILLVLICISPGCSSESSPEVVKKPQSIELDTAAVEKRKQPVAQDNLNESNEFDRTSELDRGERLVQQGDYQLAIDRFQRILLVHPGDAEVLFRIANTYAAAGQIDKAILIIDEIPEDHPTAGLPALGQSADWHLQAGEYGKAEEKYLKVLEIVPDVAMAHRNIAFLLNRQGRRHEASKHLQQLCLLGNIRQDELHALALISDAMYDAPIDATLAPNRPTPLYTPIGASGEARKRFSDEQYAAAADLIEPQVRSADAPSSMVAFFGRAVAEAQDDRRFQWWLTQVTDEVTEFSEYWSAIGIKLVMDGEYDAACRALLEAVDRDPTDIRSILRLHTTLASVGRSEASKILEQRWRQIRDLVRANNVVADAEQPSPKHILHLADLLDQSGRKIEAVMWTSIALQQSGATPDQMAELNRQRLELRKSGHGFPSRSMRLAGVKLEDFPKPDLADISSPQQNENAVDVSPELHAVPAKFANMADKFGLDHRFKIGTKAQRDGFTIYQTAGGGVAAVDYDRDGWVDLCFAQGDADPPEFITQSINELYRNIQSRVMPVSSQAGLLDTQYTIGVTAGDWNQDGFCDLAFANIGQNTLYINNGDGTFRQQALAGNQDLTLMPTSLAIADINADRLPDLIVINYAHDTKIGMYPSRDDQGRVTQSLSPLSYRGGQDALFLNSPLGIAVPQSLERDSEFTGFGVVVADITDHPGNEIFVGNDLHPNQLWVQQADADQWTDVAIVSGCAYGFSGAATASMGIAAGDFDGNQKLDLHITNFQDQASSLYLNRKDSFRDQNVWMNLANASADVLGFGTQAIDYDNDAHIDLVVTNGNIEDSLSFPAPFQQPNQLFANQGNRFELIDVVDRTGYWSKKHLGRALASFDFNRDGKMDFAVTHLNEPSALVINETDTQNHFLQVQLVATQSERDAIGAKVTIVHGEQQQTGWQIAGNGYLARNEPIIAFGLAANRLVDTLHVDWPSGVRETFQQVKADRRILVVEGQDEIFVMNP